MHRRLNHCCIRITTVVIGSLLFAACATIPLSESELQVNSKALRDQLLQLDNTVDCDEATQLAWTAVLQSEALAHEYRAMRPAWFHNYLVHRGLRDRGLCYQWTNDLFPRLDALGLKSLELHLAVARLDTSREHNCIIVTARKQPFKQGVVLDAWRESGHLWFGNAAKDSYPWKPLPDDHVPQELRSLVKS